MPNNLPLVSVLMTAFNRGKFIAEAIESVLQSSYINFELIIVDDCSTDDTFEIANSFFVKDYILAAKNYELKGVEKVLLLLHQYNLRSIGINDTGTEDSGLMKEMVVKMMG